MLFGEEPRITVGLTCETEAQERAILDNEWIRRIASRLAKRDQVAAAIRGE